MSDTPPSSEATPLDSGGAAWAEVLARVRPQLRALHRMETVAALAGGVTHEFNNLLLAIRGNAGLLLMADSLDPSSRGRLELIESAATRATELARRFQSLTRSNDAKPALIDFQDATREAVDLASLIARRKVTFKLESTDGPLPVLIDFTLAVRTLLALCFNAAEAMPDGGVVTVTVDVTSSPTNSGREALSMVRCCVRDHGPGRTTGPAEWATFLTVAPRGQGTVLGLAIARETVEAHGGRVELETGPGKGTAITLYLPQACSPAGP